MVRSGDVGAGRSRATQARGTVVRVTLVHVHASSRDVGRIIRESLVTHAGRLDAVMDLAVGVRAARDAGTRGLASGEGVTDHALLTRAAVTALRVGALAVGSAGGRVQALIDVLALGGGGRVDLLESGQALALVAAFPVVAARVGATDVLGRALVHVCTLCSHEFGHRGDDQEVHDAEAGRFHGQMQIPSPSGESSGIIVMIIFGPVVRAVVWSRVHQVGKKKNKKWKEEEIKFK